MYMSEEMQADYRENKAVAMASYLLFFLPFIIAKESRYAKYHANQGLILLLLSILVNIVSGVIPFIGHFILTAGNLAGVCLLLIGILNAYNGRCKPLPVIGEFRLIKW